MTAEHIIGIYVVIDDTMRALGHARHPLAGVSDAEVLTIAVGAAAFFGNHHARARAVLHAPGYVGRALSPSRFSRRIHALADWLALLLDVLGDLFAHGPSSAACAPSARPSRRSIANSPPWASPTCTSAPSPAWKSKFMRPCSPSPV